ncbi:platelet endothelial aggregation receptor 1-like [Ornithodoros turicata]|uniref:platelet endothelial aggregation receptor 1-like n=1 Tax=Ornithodoros turicata TaxID=34597 RepID=UPI00313979FE
MLKQCCAFMTLLGLALAQPPCTDIEFGCPEGYVCETPEQGCSSHCLCRDPSRNVTMSEDCPVRLRPCQEGIYCQPEPVGDCFACNCETPCSDVLGKFCCQPREGEACTRRWVRGSCPVCKCDPCPPPTDCPDECLVVNLDAGCRSVCVCSTKAGAPYVFLGAHNVTLPPVLLNATAGGTGEVAFVADDEVERAVTAIPEGVVAEE